MPHSDCPHHAVTVGVFDSGVGGLSVLRAIRLALPSARLLYAADSGFAPYGERTDEYVIERARHITGFMRSQGVEVIVIACNTATAAAVHMLRNEHPDTIFVGVEPGLKPAVAQSRNKVVGVLATAATLRSEKFAALLCPLEAQARVHLQACPGLAQAIEGGDLHSAEITALVERYCAPLRDTRADTVVLGCTHYPFAMESIQRALGSSVTLIDTADAVARQTAVQVESLLRRNGAPSPAGRLGRNAGEPAAGMVLAYTNGQVEALRRVCDTWLDFEVLVTAMP
jgi:glutamate racemase